MPDADATCWTLIRDAAGGDPASRDQFARVYRPVVAAYLAARWRGARLDPDDAAQDVFVECFKAGGVLEAADSGRPGGFRSFLLGVVRNVARRHEDRRRPPGPLPDQLPADETGPDEAFERAWSRSLLKEAARLQAERAASPAATRRIELLRLRFHDGLPIRTIAEKWGEDPAKVQHEYATARDEFRSALAAVVAFHHPAASAAEREQIAAGLASRV